MSRRPSAVRRVREGLRWVRVWLTATDGGGHSPRSVAQSPPPSRSRRPVLPPQMARWCRTTLREKLFKIGARLPRDARRLVLQRAEVAVTRDSLAQLLSRIKHLKPVPT